MKERILTSKGILIILVAAIVLFGGGFLIMQNANIKNRNDNAKFQNEMSNWKTYRSESNKFFGGYKFEIKYPEYFTIEDNDSPYVFFEKNIDNDSIRLFSLRLNICEMCNEPSPFNVAVTGEMNDPFAVKGGYVYFQRVLNQNTKNVEALSFERVDSKYIAKDYKETDIIKEENVYSYYSLTPTIATIIKYGNGSIVLSILGNQEIDIEKLKRKDYSDFFELEDLNTRILSTFKITK